MLQEAKEPIKLYLDGAAEPFKVAYPPLRFQFMGDPAFRPVVPISLEESANWEAKCAGCGTVHLRLRRPKAGLWRCKCPQRCEIVWQFRSRVTPE